MTLTAKQLFPRSAFVGFETMIDELDRVARHSGDTFPPHNILKTGEDQYLIELEPSPDFRKTNLRSK